MLARSASMARRSASTNTALAAPRDRASRPRPPAPAHRSSTRAPSGGGPRMLNSASRTRSAVGRVSSPAGACKRRPPRVPAMIRILKGYASLRLDGGRRYDRVSMAGPGDNLAARLLRSALERGWEGRIALREGDRTWTYAQLSEQAARVATVLRTLRVSRGERVALLMRDTLDAAAALLGTIHMGAVAVPLSEL